jgi:predicted GNAT family acetyltransferase
MLQGRRCSVDLKLDSIAVENNVAARRFEATVDGQRALLTYRRFPDRISLDHTEVPEPLRGNGLAAKLARTALEFARANHLLAVPLCPYVSRYLVKHPEYHDLLSSDDLQRILSL